MSWDRFPRTVGSVPSEEEMRKVAEDMRALARSLARDFWEAAQSGRGHGRYQSEAFRRGIRDAVHGAKDEFRHGMRYGWGPRPYRYGGPPKYGPRPPFGPPPSGGPGPRDTAAGSTGQAATGWTSPGGSAPGDTRNGPYWSGWRGPSGQAWPQPGWWSPGHPYRAPRPRRGKQPPPPVRRKWDASLLAAGLAVLFGVAWLVSGLGAVHLLTEGVLAAGLMLLGACLIVTARTDWSLSRHAWPVVVGLLLVVGLFATSASFGVTGAFSHLSFGDMHPSTPAAGGTVYGGFGQVTVDTSGLEPGKTLYVQSIAGDTRIEVAPGQTVIAQGKVLAGQVCAYGHSVASGIGAAPSPVTTPGPAAPQPAKVYVHQLAGQIVIEQPGAQGCHQ